jgi:phosphomannomutase
MPTHVFFDLDKTLTKSRSAMEPEHQELFDRLCAEKDVVVVTGGALSQIREQVTPRFDGRYYCLAQSGNEAVDKNGVVLWKEMLSDEQVSAVMAVVARLQTYFNAPADVGNTEYVENRGAQITSSVLGFHADIDAKYAFDPNDVKRQEALKHHAQDVEQLLKLGIAVEPAGTTSFNFILNGFHKGYNIGRLIEREDWKSYDCVYVGDALFPGGNDSTVIGVIPTHPVKDHNETFSFIKSDLL